MKNIRLTLTGQDGSILRQEVLSSEKATVNIKPLFLQMLREPEIVKEISKIADDVRVHANTHPGNAFRNMHCGSDKNATAKPDCPEYQKCFAEFGNNVAWACDNCSSDPEAPTDNEMVVSCELRFNFVKCGRNIAKLFE